MKHISFFLFFLTFSIPVICQDNYEEIDIVEYEGSYYKMVSNCVPVTPAPVIEHDYGMRKSRKTKYIGLVFGVLGSAAYAADPGGGFGVFGAVIGMLGGMLFQVSMVVQDVQTGIFIRDVRSTSKKQYRNNEFAGIIFFENNDSSYFKVVSFLDDSSSDPSVIIEYERYGLIKRETIKVNSPKLFWE